MEQAIISIVTSLLVSGAKKVQAIPVSPGQIAKIRATVLVLSYVLTLGTAYLNGTLADEGQIQVVADAIVSAVMSAGLYDLSKWKNG